MSGLIQGGAADPLEEKNRAASAWAAAPDTHRATLAMSAVPDHVAPIPVARVATLVDPGPPLAAADSSFDAPAGGTASEAAGGAKPESYVEAAKHAGQAVTGKFAECATAAKEYAVQTKDAALRTAEDAASAIKQRAVGLTSSAKETGSRTVSATQETASQVTRSVQAKAAAAPAVVKEYAVQTKDAAIRTAEDAASAIKQRAVRLTSSANEAGSGTVSGTQEATRQVPSLEVATPQVTSAVQEKVGVAPAATKDTTLAGKGLAASMAAKEYVMETIHSAQSKLGQIVHSVEERASHAKETNPEAVVPAHKAAADAMEEAAEEEASAKPALTMKDRAVASATDMKGRAAELTTNAKNLAGAAGSDAKDKITGTAPAEKEGAEGTSGASRTPGVYVESAKGTVTDVVNMIGKKAHQVYDNLSGRTLNETRAGEPLLLKEEVTTTKKVAFDPDTSLGDAARQLQSTS